MIAAIFTSIALGLPSAAAAAAPAMSHEFSADIVSRDAAGMVVGVGAKLYAADHKVRIQTPAAAAGYFLIDGKSGTALFVRTAQRQFMEAKQSTRLTRIFVPIHPQNPCPQWLAAEKNAAVSGAAGEWSCTRNATGTNEYRVVSLDGKSSRRWIDPHLAIPVKLRDADGTTVALEHIRVDAQPAGLFTVPPGYRKVDPQALIDRIKHSDVWVGQGSP